MPQLIYFLSTYLGTRFLFRAAVWGAALTLALVIWEKIEAAITYVTTTVASLVDPEIYGVTVRLIDGLAYIGIWGALSSILGAFLIVLTVKMAFRFIDWLLS